MYTLSRFLLLLSLLGLPSCVLFVPEPEVIVPTIVMATPTPSGTIPEVNPTATPSPILIIQPSQTPLPVATVTTTTELTLPTIIQTLIPTFTPSPIPTSTSITAIFLTPTADWQPVQVGHAVIEIPLGWIDYLAPGGDGAYFISVDPDILAQGGSLNQGVAWMAYSESDPYPIPTTTITVDGYSTNYGITVDSDFDFDVTPLWLGIIDIYTPERRHQIQLRCSAPSRLGEPRQREFHTYCESIIQHWIETTQILE